MNEFQPKIITPFGFYCQHVLPLIYDQSLSYYEVLCKIQEKLNEVIKTQNELQDAFQNLLTWIEQEIQNEINKILNEWKDDGTLETIIAGHLDIAITMNTTTELLSGTHSIQAGNVVNTMGYATVGDNGGATFIITDTEPSTYNFKITGMNLWAKIVTQNKMNVLQFGIVGDGVTDVTEAYQKAINHVCTYGDSYIYVPKGTYMIDGIDHSRTPSDTGHLRDAGGIKVLSGLTIEHDNEAIMQIIATNYQAYNLYRIYNVQDVTVRGGILNGDRETHFGGYGGEWGYMIAISGSRNVHIENLTCQNAWGDGIDMQYLFAETSLTQSQKTCTNIYITNVVSNMNRRQGLSLESGENVIIKECRFTNTNGTPPQFGIDIEPANSNSTVNNVHIENCYFDGNQSRQLGMYAFESSCKITNVYIEKCYFGKCYNSDQYAVSMEANTDYIYFNDNTFDFTRPSVSNIAYKIIMTYAGHYTFKNNVFKDCQLYSHNVNSNLTFINNVIESYQAPNFFQVFGMGQWIIKNNICNTAKTGFFLFTGAVNGSLIFNDNILLFQGTNAQALILDNSPNTPVLAVNNYLQGQGARITWLNLLANHMISQGAFTGLNVVATRPTGARIGTMCYEQNTGKPIFYTGSKWIFADGTNA